MSAVVKLGGFVGTYGTRAVLGAGYIALRAGYALGEAGEAAIATGTVEAERLANAHAAKMAANTVAATARRAELQAKLLLLLKNEKAAGLAIEATTAAVMQPVAEPIAAVKVGKTAKA